MSNKIADELLKNISLTSRKKQKRTNTKNKIKKWFKKNLISISLIILLVISVAQATQLMFIYSNLNNSSAGTVSTPSSLDALPDMVGGC